MYGIPAMRAAEWLAVFLIVSVVGGNAWMVVDTLWHTSDLASKCAGGGMCNVCMLCAYVHACVCAPHRPLLLLLYMGGPVHFMYVCMHVCVCVCVHCAVDSELPVTGLLAPTNAR